MDKKSYSSKASGTFQKKDVYEQVTNIIIKQLEEGTVPWQQTWIAGKSSFQKMPRNFTTGNLYRGINIVLLWSASLDRQYTSNEWASFKQWSSKKETIRKGEKGNLVVYADKFEKEVDGELTKIPFLKTSYVFNKCQLASFKEEALPMFEPVVIEKNAIDKYVDLTGAKINNKSGDAYYSLLNDEITMPLRDQFIETVDGSASDNYYATLFHELIHWTGHKNRMNRDIAHKFGSAGYAAEELVAELGAAFLCSQFNLSPEPKANHASYINNWLKVLKDNKKMLVSASSKAIKGIDYISSLQTNQPN